MGVDNVDGMTQEEYRAAAIAAVAKLSSDVGIPTKLSELGVKAEDIDFLAQSALVDACTPGNPRDVTKEEIAEIYRSIF